MAGPMARPMARTMAGWGASSGGYAHRRGGGERAWVQAVAAGLRIREIPVSLIYNDPSRSFGGPLDDPDNRLDAYLATFHLELSRCAEQLSLHGGD